MSEFKRELRYFVMKVRDVDECFSEEEKLLLNTLLEKLHQYRESQNKDPLVCVVVEDDWIEYEDVWSMLKKRFENALKP